MDELVKKIAALGVPGLVFLVAVSATGLSGAAAITAALAALGPGGMIGGIGFLLIIGLVADKVSEFGIEAIVKAVVKEMLKTKTREKLISEIRDFPFSRSLKLKVEDYVKKYAI